MNNELFYLVLEHKECFACKNKYIRVLKLKCLFCYKYFQETTNLLWLLICTHRKIRSK